jgi:hypothetical protein
MNDFVNPQHRGVNLPEGFKDLMDVLEAKKHSGTPETSNTSKIYSRVKFERIPCGGLAQVEKHLRYFLTARSEVPSPCLLSMSAHKGILFFLLSSKKGPYAAFSFYTPNTAEEKSVREIITNMGVNHVSPEIAAGKKSDQDQVCPPF